jgi:hypothetical protein
MKILPNCFTQLLSEILEDQSQEKPLASSISDSTYSMGIDFTSEIELILRIAESAQKKIGENFLVTLMQALQVLGKKN